MRITVIGRSPAWQDANGACSGYLVESGEAKILIDCGNGVFGKLRGQLDHRDLDAVVISHSHGDHILDLFPFAYALIYGPPRTAGKPILYLPPGGMEVLRTIAGSFDNETLIEDAFETVEYVPEDGVTIGDIAIEMAEVPHFTRAYAMAISTSTQAKFVYGADCGVSGALVELARGAEVLMVEATLPAGQPADPQAESGHLTPAQAGQIARDAEVGRLVLTHASDVLDLEGSRQAAAAVFAGPVEMSAQGSSWNL
ncbi:MAG: MBL fold metallo-hydrolase [Actinomycetes bacterium]